MKLQAVMTYCVMPVRPAMMPPMPPPTMAPMSGKRLVNRTPYTPGSVTEHSAVTPALTATDLSSRFFSTREAAKQAPATAMLAATMPAQMSGSEPTSDIRMNCSGYRALFMPKNTRNGVKQPTKATATGGQAW